MEKQRENERGQAAILLALAMVGLIAFAALAIDGGNAYYMKRNAQNAADAAMFVGSRELHAIQLKDIVGVDVPCVEDEGLEYGTCLLREINDAAERNGVPDTDGDLAINANVEAFFVLEGAVVSSDLITPALETLPADAQGVAVYATIPFDTFIAGLIGRPEMAATARAAGYVTKKYPAVANAIWADADCEHSTVCKISGSYQEVEGGIHSNANLDLSGVGTTSNPAVFTSTLEYAQDAQLDEDKIDIAPTWGISNPVQVAVDFLDPLFFISDYAPGGSGAQSATDDGRYFVYPSAPGTPDMIMQAGLHFSLDPDGLNVGHMDTSMPLLITIVVTDGLITVQDDTYFLPYIDGLLLFSPAGDKGCPSNVNAIKMVGSELDWEGMVYAPNGHVLMSASDNSSMRGSIVAWTIDLSGSDFSLTYDPKYDPLRDPRVIPIW